MEKQVFVLSDEVIETMLDGRDVPTLARWSCTLNEWEWPEDMPNKPPGFSELPWYYFLDDPRRGNLLTRMDYIEPLTRAIAGRIGEKEVMRHHHLYNLHLTNEQFEHWWSLDSSGDEEGALEYYIGLKHIDGNERPQKEGNNEPG